MGASTSRLERGLLLIATVLALCFFVAALVSTSPWSDLFIGMATSFVFFIVFDLILAVQRSVRQRRRRSFFGSEMFDDELWMTVADFELRTDIDVLLTPEQRRAPYQRPVIPGLPEHPHPMLQTTMMCLMDIRAVLVVAEELAPWCKASPRITTDTDALHDRARSFLASGLTDNHCTAMYLLDDPHPLFTIDSRAIDARVTLVDGHAIENSASREYGIILRYAPDRTRQPGRRWFIVAGLDEAGSAAAGHLLAHEWRNLAQFVNGDDDFVAVVELPLHAWWEPTLTHVVTRDGAGAVSSISVPAGGRA